MTAHPIVRQIVNRCHVSANNRDIVATVRAALAPHALAPDRRDARKELYRQAIDHHRYNREEYAAVVAGRLDLHPGA